MASTGANSVQFVWGAINRRVLGNSSIYWSKLVEHCVRMTQWRTGGFHTKVLFRHSVEEEEEVQTHNSFLKNEIRPWNPGVKSVRGAIDKKHKVIMYRECYYIGFREIRLCISIEFNQIGWPLAVFYSRCPVLRFWTKIFQKKVQRWVFWMNIKWKLVGVGRFCVLTVIKPKYYYYDLLFLVYVYSVFSVKSKVANTS